MEMTCVVEMVVNHQPGDEIPVFLRNGVIVGKVVVVRNHGELTEVRAEVRDEVIHSAMKIHAETGLPVFHIHFPRLPGETEPLEFSFGD